MTLLWNGQRLPSYVLDAALIADVEVAPAPASASNVPTPTIPQQPTQTLPVGHALSPTSSSISQQASFHDPAIVSYNKPILQSVSPIMIADGVVPSPISQHDRAIAKQSSVSSIATTHFKKPNRRDSEANAVLTEPFDAMALGEVDTNKKSTKRHKSTPSQTGPGVIDIKDMQPLPQQKTAKNQKPGKGKGWRSTPLIEERPTRRQRARKAEDQNGWATEDATDIQDMGEFDFAGNLSKFNKRQVFDDLRSNDQIPQDERLVSFNRTAKPGTNGGRNLHFSENVLDRDTNDLWKSEAGETEEENPHEADQYVSSGKGSRRANSRRPLASRKGGAIPGYIAPERQASPRPLSRVATATMNGTSSVSASTKALFRLFNNRPCHCVSPLQMLELEQLCTSDLGLTEDMLSENAGRSIAEAVLKFHSSAKSVVFLVGNHKSGTRSVVAARHLRNRRLRVTVVLLGGEREESALLESLKRQLNIYRKGGGWVERWDEYQTKLNSGAPKPDAIVDSILGMHVSFDELRTDDQAVCFEMTKWANRMGNIISIDVPSGVSATSGLLTETEDSQTLAMEPSKIVCLGAPKTGLLQAFVLEVLAADTEVVVADVGISGAAWQRHGSRRRQGVEFSGEWVLGVRYVPG